MGILTHTGPKQPETLEARIVRHADQIAYVNHDIDDAIRAGILDNSDIPRELRECLGYLHKERINTVVCDIVANTRKTGELMMSGEIHRAHHALRDFMFNHVYRHPVAKGEEKKARAMLQRLFEYYMKHPEALPADFLPQLSFGGMERTVCDYIAGMTDKYAVDKYSELFIPSGWNVRG
jgi:dGTPase